jgi:uncharacterized membrane protein YbhN (UPF0104 family)
LATGVLAGPHQPLLTLLPALVGGVVIGLFLAVPGPLTRIADRHAGGHSRIAAILTSVAAGIRESLRVLRRPNWRLLGSVGYWIFDVAALWLAFRALGSAPPFGAVVMGYLVGMAANMLPIPGGIGAVDLGLAGMLTLYGAALSTAAAAVLIYRAISLWIPTLVGTVAYLLLRDDLERPIAPRGGSWPRSADSASARSSDDGLSNLVPDLPTRFNSGTSTPRAIQERQP